MRISDWSSDVCSSDLPFEQFGDMIVDLGLADASDPQREGHIVERRQMRDETEILKHHPDPPPERWKARTRHGDDILPEQRNEPPAWPLRQIKQAKQRRLSRPRRTAQKMKRAFLQRDVQIEPRLRARAIAHAAIPESNNDAPCFNLIANQHRKDSGEERV